ncbi:MAG: MOSC N-terminal beta barrel domain-containing protein [Gammaproteobacteria bacterium]|nr:MOSC N-terminal beta barrel domain-containing protein [Gammaproteobacteria bacterium]
MLIIKQLWVYPIKSCKGIELNSVDCLVSGLRHDREMMIIDEHGKFVTQRSDAILAHIGVQLHGEDKVEVDYKEQRCVFSKSYSQPVSAEVWRRPVSGFDQGDLIANFLTSIIGKKVRLIATRPTDTRPPENNILFQDGQAVHIISEASLQHAQKHLPELMIDTRRFRPNIIIGNSTDTPQNEKLSAFAEDSWKTVTINSVKITVDRLCERCNIPSIAPDTLSVDNNVHKYFQDYRIINKRPMFGICGSILSNDLITIGDIAKISSN